MARKREIKPGFFHCEEAARCSAHARLLFIGLWTLADKRGRLREQAPVIHGAIFPYEPHLDVPAMLEELRRAGFLIRYEVDGKRYVQVVNFEKHQRPHPNEPESVIPAVANVIRGGDQKEKPLLEMLPIPSVPSMPSEEQILAPPSATLTTPQPKQQAPSWSRDACDDWKAHLGTPPGNRIGAALRPLVKEHGWDKVRPVWRNACASAAQEPDPGFFTPEVFARTFKARLAAPRGGPRGRPTVTEANKAVLDAWEADVAEGRR